MDRIPTRSNGGARAQAGGTLGGTRRTRSGVDPGQARHFLARLDHFGRLSDEEKAALCAAMTPPRRLGAHDEMMARNVPASGMHIVLSGFAARIRRLGNGRRQITAYLVPGDICDFRFLDMGRTDHGVETLARTGATTIPFPGLIDICERFPRIMRALLRAAAVDEAVAREWLINLGQRTAGQRMAHMFCELHVRMRIVGLASRASYELPLTQAELGEALGLSTVHVNRTLQELRRSGLITVRGGLVTLDDPQALAETAMFEGAYLGAEAGEPQ